ncbi:long-chain-fatty-acid--CoA ligase [Nocardioides insulae]|uniref:long-chain-fatty-acid--CoA ligase n=1 Tax=Nocardioides insulae TaxID=394734 RepID=UPI00040C30DD|nr:long-chain-fatty-acid--CoA ligase [Nocardioides insulae]
MTPIDAARRINWSAFLTRHVHEQPDEVVLRFRGEATTWREFDDRVSRLATWLQGQGIKKGDRVGALTLNRTQFIDLVAATIRVGAIFVPYNFRLSPAELNYVLTDSGPSVVLVEAPLLPSYQASGYDQATVLTIDVPEPPAGAFDVDAVTAETPNDWELVDIDDNDPMTILYTSGTTGYPKGAVLTHQNMFVQGLSGIMGAQPWETGVRLLGVPLFHVAGIGNLTGMFMVGGVTVLQPLGAFDATETVDILEREQITGTFFVPAQWQAIVDLPGIKDRKLPLRTISWGAAPASTTLLQQMSETFPEAQILCAFGQTEMSPVTTILKGDDAITKMGSVGKPVPYVSVRIVDPLMNDVAVGEVGEIVYRGPNTMVGYWNKPEATEEAFRGGWFHSGDLCKMDEDGFIYVVDRLKDMIISGGENIYCAEVENAIFAHPDIADVAVVGRPDEKWGEAPVAVLVAKPGATAPSIEELRQFLNDKLARFKHPHEVLVIDELPRNASGKVIKPPLREQVKG